MVSDCSSDRIAYVNPLSSRWQWTSLSKSTIWHPTMVLLPRFEYMYKIWLGTPPMFRKAVLRLTNTNCTWHFHTLQFLLIAHHNNIGSWASLSMTPFTLGSSVNVRLWASRIPGRRKMTNFVVVWSTIAMAHCKIIVLIHLQALRVRRDRTWSNACTIQALDDGQKKLVPFVFWHQLLHVVTLATYWWFMLITLTCKVGKRRRTYLCNV